MIAAQLVEQAIGRAFGPIEAEEAVAHVGVIPEAELRPQRRSVARGETVEVVDRCGYCVVGEPCDRSHVQRALGLAYVWKKGGLEWD